ncbi:MAG: flagellin [Methanoregula sp.]|nr:flagellin [Methanoregula sp.]
MKSNQIEAWIAMHSFPCLLKKQGEFMNSFKQNDDGFTGLEAAIVLIAFVVVAAVFSYVVLGAGFFTTQKAQETVYKGVEQSTSNLQLIGNVYARGTGTAGARTIDQISFTLTVAPGAPSLDLEKMKIVFSTPDTTPQIYSQNNTASAPPFNFTTKLNAVTSVGSMSSGDQVEVSFLVPNVAKSTKMNFELRPISGAALPFSKSAPGTIEVTNILY